MSSGRHLGKGSKIPIIPDDGKLRLYSMRFCPFAHRAHLVLNAKNIPHHIIYIDLKNKPEWLIEKSPLLKVPALELPNESKTLIESLIICDYLDEKYSSVKLHPEDPLQKAEDRILVERFSTIAGLLHKVFVENELQAGLITDIKNGLDIYENELKLRGGPFFAGNKPGMLDYMIWPWCERTDMLKYLLEGDTYVLDKDRFEKLLEWREIMIEENAIKLHYLDGESHAKFMKTYRTGEPNFNILE